MQYGVRQLGAERGPVSAAPQPTLGLASAAGTSGGRGDTASSSRTSDIRARDHTHLPLVLAAGLPSPTASACPLIPGRLGTEREMFARLETRALISSH